MNGVNAQIAALSSPICAPVIAASRLRKGNTVSGKGAARLITDSVSAARAAGAAIAFNLLRAAGAAACARHAKARWATLRAHLIAVPGRVASTGRRLVLHLPTDWPWTTAWEDLWATATST